MDNIIDFAKARISQSSLTTDPWDYLYIENLLPEEFYDELYKETMSLLNHDRLKDNARGTVALYDTRKSDEDESKVTNITLRSKQKRHWGPFHKTRGPHSSEFCNLFMDKVVQDLLLVKFKNSGRCAEVPQPKIAGGYITYDVQTPGFKYKIHGEAHQKILSILFYLAAPGDDENIGTRLYPGHTHWNNLDFDKDCVKIVPYKPNSVLIFSRTNKKWSDTSGVTHRQISNHAMANSSTKTRLRRSIQLFYMDENAGGQVDDGMSGQLHMNKKYESKDWDPDDQVFQELKF